MLPVLPVETLVVYQKRLGIVPQASEKGQQSILPQHLADRFGWENMTATVAAVYAKLSPEQQAQSAILTANYGEAGAIDYYGPRFGLPPAMSGHNTYYLWGPGEISGNVIISVGIPAEDLQRVFEVVSPAATIVSPYAMPHETNLTVYVCSGLKMPLAEAWRRVKRYI